MYKKAIKREFNKTEVHLDQKYTFRSIGRDKKNIVVPVCTPREEM
jgi:hypothetical protein